MMPHDHVLTVSALTKAIKGNLEQQFPFVWVRGQVTNVARPSSGHLYFSLRDEEASLAAVWFKRQHGSAQRFDPLTGEVYEDGPRQNLAQRLENGQEILCAGQLSVYAPRGTYQLLVEFAEETGQGRLQIEFEKLKATLSAKGYFAHERKRCLPAQPKKVAVITSPQGAAVYDFLRIANARSCGAHIHIFPVSVQGDTAPPQICQAISQANAIGNYDIIVLIRGGGSLEDLWAFNTLEVAEAIYTSRIPILAGIGHEIDVTLADMTADARAATPTHAAQMLWKERRELYDELNKLLSAFIRAQKRCEENRAFTFRHLTKALEWQKPERKLMLFEQRLDFALQQLQSAGQQQIAAKAARLPTLLAAMRRSPEEALQLRLQRLTHSQKLLDAHITRGIAAAESKLALLRPALRAMPSGFKNKEHTLTQLQEQLLKQNVMRLAEFRHRLEVLFLRLNALHPYAPLERGYALLSNNQGQFIDSRFLVQSDEHLSVQVRDGTFHVRVEGDPHDPSAPKS